MERITGTKSVHGVDEPGGITDLVTDSFAGAPSPRLKRVMTSLVAHLHSFVRDVQLTDSEWQLGIDFLTRVGHLTDEKRQEFILLSDVLGLSMLVVEINHPSAETATPSTVFGPFFVDGSPHIPLGGDLGNGLVGDPCWVSGRVTSDQGVPVAGAKIEVWEADGAGFYDVQYEGSEHAGRGHLFTDADGRYSFWSVLPAPYPIPHDGPVGELLASLGRGPMRPAHIHFMVSAPGMRTLITHVFVKSSPHLEDDAVFGVKDELVLDFATRSPGVGPGGRQLTSRWFEGKFDIVLASIQGDAE